MLLSFTIPCYKSSCTIKGVVDEVISRVQEMGGYDYEIILVNDASPDETWETLKELSDKNPRIRAIDLAKNVGKHAALMAAFSMVEGDIVIGLDDDGQCPLDELPRLLSPLSDGYDMSMAQYPKKKQGLFKNFGSRVNDFMVRFLVGKPKGMAFSNFIARKRFVCDEIIKYTNPYPYLEGLTLRTTHRIAMVPMEERARQAGRSGYTFRKSLALWLNGCTAFSVKPLRLATVLGLVFSVIGFCTGMFMVVRKLAGADIQAGYTSIVALMLLIGGIIMVLLGVIGEYLGRIYICINRSPQYVIREKRNVEMKGREEIGYHEISKEASWSVCADRFDAVSENTKEG